MKTGFFKKHFCLLLCWFYTISVLIVPSEAYAIYTGVRNNSYTSSGNCNTGLISPDPFTSNKDIQWNMSNPTCIAYAASVGFAMVYNGVATRIACRAANQIGNGQTTLEEIQEADWDLPTLTPATWRKTITRGKRCAARNAELASWTTIMSTSCPVPTPTPIQIANCTLATDQMPLAAADATRCCGAYAKWMTSVGLAIARLAIIYGVAKVSYDNAKICGHNWSKWSDAGGGKWIKGKGDYAKCLEKTFYNVSLSGVDCSKYNISPNANITNKDYRSFIYGGIEYEDSEGECRNPWTDQDRLKYLGYTDSKMRFYMTGPGNAPVYACHRFLRKLRDPASLTAYECCKKRSQSAICIESSDGVRSYSKFCDVDSKCWVGPVNYEIYGSRVESNYVCAKTFSVCPYNHLLGGGTEDVEMMSSPNEMYKKNFCQHLKHCSKLPILPYIKTIELEGGFISSACKDMRGDSQNIYGYESGIVPVRTRGFSAPMAQCFKETLENVLLNTAGDTKCVNADESPGADGSCASGYIYRKGSELNNPSFLSKIRNGLQSVIKMALVLSIVAFGIMILFAVPSAAIEKKKLLPYILKIGLVVYFAAGDGWHQPFLRGILGTSTFLSELVFDVDVAKDTVSSSGNVVVISRENQRDGCQFPRFNYADTNEGTRYNKPSYPKGKEYLEIWDTLDCKIARALGFGPDVSVPNILIMIVAGFFTGGLGILFVVGSFLFAFFLISVTVRALHIFLVSVIAIVIMIYVSPITITMSLFERTKGIFDGWKKQLLGFILQPMILFAYLGMLIALFDHTMIGRDVTFEGDANKGMKRIVCNSKAEETSMYCIFRVSKVKTWHGLEFIGVGIPILEDMNAEKLNSIVKAAILMFIFANFMDKITGFAKELVGGAEMSNGWNISTAKIASKAKGIARGVQKRGMRAVQKHGSAAARGAGNLALAGVRRATNKGTSVSKPESDSSGGSAGGSSGGSSGGVGNP